MQNYVETFIRILSKIYQSAQQKQRLNIEARQINFNFKELLNIKFALNQHLLLKISVS